MRAQPPPGPWRPNPTVPEDRGTWSPWRRRRPRLPSIEILRLEPGDILTVKADYPISQAQAEHIRSHFADRIPGHEILVISIGVELGVIRPEDR